jgi:transcriptional regulator with XRE-family HTH domain
MSGRGALGEFLRNRRGRIGPAEVGLPPGTGRRQTPGLRREELAAVAGVSVDYYIRLEQGRDTHPGPAVLDAIASALRLDDDERAHLHRLAEAGTEAGTRAGARAGAGPAVSTSVRPGMLRLLDSVRPTPGYVLTQASDVLAANPEGLQLLVGLRDWPERRRNIVRYVFTHPAARDVFTEWRRMAEDCVAHLRDVSAAGPRPLGLPALVTELSGVSPEFAELWRHYDVRVKSGALRAFRHPAVGRFELTSEILTAVDGHRFVAFQAEPGSPDHDAITLLSLATGVTRD